MTDPPLRSPLQTIYPWNDTLITIPGTDTTLAGLRAALHTGDAHSLEASQMIRIATGLLAVLDDLHDQMEQALWRFDPVALFQSWTHTLGPTITGFVMGATAEEVEAWADPDNPTDYPAPQRLEGVAFAQRIWAEMAHHLGDDDEARLWFLTSSPWLPDDATPLQAIRERDFAAVAHAASQHRREETLRRPTAAKRQPSTPIQIWGVWDAGELFSLHTTERDAKDACDVHTQQALADFPDDEQLIRNTIRVNPLRLHIDGNRRTPAEYALGSGERD